MMLEGYNNKNVGKSISSRLDDKFKSVFTFQNSYLFTRLIGTLEIEHILYNPMLRVC